MLQYNPWNDRYDLLAFCDSAADPETDALPHRPITFAITIILNDDEVTFRQKRKKRRKKEKERSTANAHILRNGMFDGIPLALRRYPQNQNTKCWDAFDCMDFSFHLGTAGVFVQLHIRIVNDVIAVLLWRNKRKKRKKEMHLYIR